MSSTVRTEFPVVVNLPRSYLGRATLQVGSSSVALVARRLRHLRAVVLAWVAVVAVLMVGAFALPMRLEFQALLVGLAGGVLAGVLYQALFSSVGEPRAMSVPLSSVSVRRRRGRVVVVSAAFDPSARSGEWTLVAASPGDAEALAAALTVTA